MNNQETIANLNMISVAFVEPVTKEQRKLIDDTFDNAIKVLEQKPCEDAISRQAVFEQINCWIGSGEYRYTNATHYLTERVKHISSVNPQAPYGDLISRVKHAIYKVCLYEGNKDIFTKILDEINKLSSVKQEPKYCDRNICLKNEYNGIGCDECEVTKSQEPQESEEV